MRIVLFWFCLLRLAYADAQPVIPVDPGDQMLNLSHQAMYFEDPEGRVTISELLEQKFTGRFKPVESRIVNFGITSSAYWLRFSLQNNTPDKVVVEVGNNALSDVRLYEATQNQLVRQFKTGNWEPFSKREMQSVSYLFPLALKQGEQSTIFLRVQHPRGTQFRLKAGTLVALYEAGTRRSLLEGMYYGFMLVMILYNLFLYFSLRDTAYFFYVVYIFFMALLNATINGFAYRFLWPTDPALNDYEDIIAGFAGIAGIMFAARFLNTRKNAPVFHRIFFGLLAIYVAAIFIILSGQFQTGIVILEINSLLLVISFFLAAYQTMRHGYKPAKFFLIAWSFLLLSVIVFILSNFNVIASSTFVSYSIQIGSAVEALLLSMALANRINVYKEEKSNAEKAALRSLEKNKKLIVEQNMMLERKVAERTEALRKTNDELVKAMQDLKETQEQLVQREKMASLGELTAGIAHEIQNPLNFVNNFSEVSSELVDELKDEMGNDRKEVATGIADSLKENLQKILAHGRRADSIVRSMLEHSRQHNGLRQAVTPDEIICESLNLSYQAMRASDKTFTAILETHFDEHVGKVEVVAQDISRVLLNLFNNAFYSMREKKRKGAGDYQPVLSVCTRRREGIAEITIRDNGAGIPQKLVDKIFQPFFTTKPAGEGTGLGLSLSYDIVTKGHGGKLTVTSTEGEGSAFVLELPLTAQALLHD